jgi:hypothetical protein
MNHHDNLTAAWECAHEMMRSAEVVLEGIKGRQLPESSVFDIQDLCDECISTKFDVIHEIGEIHDLERQGESVEGIQRRLSMVHRWLMESVGESSRCVRRLSRAADKGELVDSVLVILVESATHVLECQEGMSANCSIS